VKQKGQAGRGESENLRGRAKEKHQKEKNLHDKSKDHGMNKISAGEIIIRHDEQAVLF